MTAQVSLISDVERAIKLSSAERRAEMLLHVTDLFISEADRISDEEIGLFDDVILRLATDIEVSARALLAQRLAPVARAPINIVRKLATDDEISIASPVLIHSERLDEETLIETARAKSQSHLLAISQRKALSDVVTDVLVERGNRHVILSTAKNPGARFSNKSFSRLIERSNGDDALAICVGTRKDIPYDLFLSLLATASELVRNKLLAEAPDARLEVEQAVTAVTNAVHNKVGSGKFAAGNAFIQSLYNANQLNDGAIRAFAEADKFEETVAAIACLCQVPLVVLERAMNQKQWQTLLVFAKAAKLSRPTVKALLVLCGQQHFASPDVLDQSLASFDRLNPQTARKIIEFYRMGSNKARPS